MISDINEFCKLYKVHIPVPNEQEYYFSLLQQSTQFSFLSETISNFENWEEEMKISGEILKKKKFKYQENLIKKLSETFSYRNSLGRNTLSDHDSSSESFSFIDSRKENLNKHLVSFDIKSANYSLFKYFGSNKELPNSCKELPNSWNEFVIENNLPAALQKSKSFRQVIFGNLNPKKTQKLIFSELTIPLKSKIDSLFNTQETCCYLSTDEITYTFDSYIDAFNFCKLIPFKIENEKGFKINYRMNYSHPQKIPDKDFYYANVVEDILFLGGEQNLEQAGKKYSKLIGVPGNQFYIYFKKYILNQNLEERDLFFQQDGQLAKWVV